MNRREFLKAVAVAGGTLFAGGMGLTRCSRSQPSTKKQGFSFAFITDLHLRPGMREERLRRCIDMINEKSCDFVVTGGDLVEDALGVGYDAAKGQYDLVESVLVDLKVPVYHTIGNHELFGVYVESGVSPEHAEYGKEMYRQRIGAGRTYYSFDYGDWHFVSLDSMKIEGRKFVGGVDEAQMNWLRNDFATVGQKRPVCLVTHIPMVSSWVQLRHGITVAPSPEGFIVNNKELYQAFEPYNLKLVLQGHLHVLEDWSFNGTRFIGAGAVSGGWGTGPLDGPGPSFGIVTIVGEDVAYEHVRIPLG